MRSIRATDEIGEMIEVAGGLQSRLPQLTGNALFAASIPQFLSLGGYKFIVAEAGTVDDPAAFGLLTIYKAPMAESVVLAVEAMWFKALELRDQLWIWADLAAYAQRLELGGLCVAETSVNTPGALDFLTEAGAFRTSSGEVYLAQCGEPVLQGTVEGLYSAFEGRGLTGSAFFARCVVIGPASSVDLGGTPAAS